MDFTQLRYFQVTAEEEHLTRAAGLLHITQPALSMALARLESELGAPLFDRVGRNIRLNESGAIFLRHANTILAALHQAEKELGDRLDTGQENLTLGMTSFVATQDMLNSFIQDNPDVRIKQATLMLADVSKELGRGKIDFAISGMPVKGAAIAGKIIAGQRLLLAVGKEHPFAGRESIDLAEAKDEGFICLARGYAYRQFTDELCREAGFTQNVVREHFHSQLLPLVASGSGIGIALDHPERNAAFVDKIAFIPIVKPARTRDIYLLWNKKCYMTRAARLFKDYALAFYADHK